MKTHNKDIIVLTSIAISFITFASCIYFLTHAHLSPPQATILMWQLVTLILAFTIIFYSCYFFIAKRKLHSRPREANNNTSQKSINTASASITPISNNTHTNDNIHDHTHNYTNIIKILIVDDNPANALFIEESLSKKNYAIHCITNGEQAATGFVAYSPDIVIMDIEMGAISGFEVAAKIRKLEKNTLPANKKKRTVIIANSAHTENTYILQALAKGFDDYISKPNSIEKICTTINQWQTRIVANGTEQKQTHADIASLNSKHVPTSASHSKPLEKKSSPSTPKKNAPSKTIRLIPSKKSKKNVRVVDIALSLTKSNQSNTLAIKMLTLLLDMLQKEKPIIEEYVKNEAWQQLYQLNHKILGGSAYCGTPYLFDANQKLERLLQHECLPDAESTNTNSILNISATQKQNIITATQEVLTEIDKLLAWQDTHDIECIFNG